MLRTAQTVQNGQIETVIIPRAQIPKPIKKRHYPLTEKVAKQIGEIWAHCGSYSDIADDVITTIIQHIKKSPLENMDTRLVDAIDDYMSHDPIEGDADQEGECTPEEMESVYARRYMRDQINKCTKNENKYIRKEAEQMLGMMLKRPGETKRYLELRQDGCPATTCLSVILAERIKGDGVRI